MSEDYAHRVVLSLIAQTCQYVGWTAATKSSLDIFSDVFERYVGNFGKTIKAYTELGNRTYPLQEDIVLTLKALGVSVEDLDEYTTDVPSFPFAKNVPTFPLHKLNNLQVPDINDLKQEHRPDYIPDFYPLLISKQNYSAKTETQVDSKESIVEENKFGFSGDFISGEPIKNSGKLLHKNLLKNYIPAMGMIEQVKEIKAIKKLPVNLLKHLISSSADSEDEVFDTKLIVPEIPINVDLPNKFQSPIKNSLKNQITPSKKKVGRPKKLEESPTKNLNITTGDEEILDIKLEKSIPEDLIVKTKSSIVESKKNEGKKKTSKELIHSATTTLTSSKTIIQSSQYNTLENELFSSPLILPKFKEPVVKTAVIQEMPPQTTHLNTLKSNKKALTKVAPNSQLNKKDIQTTSRKDKFVNDNITKEKKLFSTSPPKISGLVKSEYQQPATDELIRTDLPESFLKSQPRPNPNRTDSLDKDKRKVEGFSTTMSKGKKRKKIALSSRKVKKTFVNPRKSLDWEVEKPADSIEESSYRKEIKIETAEEESSIQCPTTSYPTDFKGVLGSPTQNVEYKDEHVVEEQVVISSPLGKETPFDELLPSDESDKAPSTSISDGQSDNGGQAIKYEITTPTPSYSATPIFEAHHPHHVIPAAGGPIKIKIFKRTAPPQLSAAPPHPPVTPQPRPPPIYTPSGSSEEEGGGDDLPIPTLPSRDIEAPPPVVVGYGLSNFIDHVTDAELFRRSAAASAVMTSSSSVSPSSTSPASSSRNAGRLDEVNLLRRRKMTKKSKTTFPSPNSKYDDGTPQSFQTSPLHPNFSLAPKQPFALLRAKSKHGSVAKKRKKHPPYHHRDSSCRISGPGLEEESVEYIPAKKRRRSIDAVDESDTFFGSSRPSSLPPSSTKEVTVLAPIHSDQMLPAAMVVGGKSGGKKGKKHPAQNRPFSPSPLQLLPSPLELTLPSVSPVSANTPGGVGVQRTVFTETLGSAVVSDNGEKIWICPACTHPDDGSPMIGCDNCDDWYHWVCVNITEPPDENENWYCSRCLAKRLTSSKKKKRKKR